MLHYELTDEPEPPAISGRLSATEGQLVTLNCSLRYHCPSRPPTLQWKWERGPPLESTELWDAQTTYPDVDGPTLLASLSFTASHQVKPRLKCEVSYPGANMVSTTTDLHVTCKHNISTRFCLTIDIYALFLSPFMF